MKASLYQQVEALFKYAENPVKRVGTGFAPIDELIVGPAPGEVCMVVGRSYSGKSIVGQNIIYNNPDIPSIFFSMEMPFMQALVRMYSMWSDTPSSEVQESVEAGQPNSKMWELVTAFPKHVILDQPALTLEEMSIALDQYAEAYSQRPEFIVLDYLELLGGAKASGEGYIATEQQATMLKDWAKQEEMRVFLLHQANKQEPRWLPPTDNSPRNGGFVEADFVIGAWRPHTDPKLDFMERLSLKNVIRFNVLKNRVFFKEAERIDMVVTPSLRIEGKYARHSNSRTTTQVSESQSWDKPDPYAG